VRGTDCTCGVGASLWKKGGEKGVVKCLRKPVLYWRKGSPPPDRRERRRDVNTDGLRYLALDATSLQKYHGKKTDLGKGRENYLWPSPKAREKRKQGWVEHRSET